MVDNNKFVSLVEDTDNNNNNNSNNNNGNSNNNNNIQYYQQRRNSLTYNPISDSSSNSNNNNNSINNSFSNENINDVPETLTQREYADADYDSDIEDGGVISGIGSDGLVEETTTLIGKETNIIIDNGIIGIGSGGGLTHSGSNVIITVKEDIITTTTTTKHKKPQGMCYDGRRNYILMVDCLYSLLFAPIVYFIHYIPNTVFSTEGEQGEFWKYWYHNIAWSKYFLWMISIISGFAYVAVITEKRTVPFHCRYKRHRDFFQLLFAATIWFAIGGPSRALFGKDDIVTGLKDGITQNTSNGYSAGESFFYNYGFFLSFLLGLHFTYLDRVIFLRYMGDKFGTPSLWKTFKPLELIVLCPIILFILSLAALHIYLLIQDHLWEYFAIGYAIFFVVLIGVSVLIRKTYYLHMHHYFIFGTMIPLCGFQTALSIFSLGVVSGISVEGISRWSFGWLWYRGVREFTWLNFTISVSNIVPVIDSIVQTNNSFTFIGSFFSYVEIDIVVTIGGGIKIKLPISNWNYKSLQIQELNGYENDCNQNNGLIVEQSSNSISLNNNFKNNQKQQVLYGRFQDKVLSNNVPTIVTTKLYTS